MRGSVAPIMIALMFTQLEGVNERLCALLHGGREVEENLIAVQKLLKLQETVQETKLHPVTAKEATIPENWPTAGAISVNKVDLRYRPKTDLVLKDLSFETQAGHKVGIVGRTGSGKSTFCLALCRIMEAESG